MTSEIRSSRTSTRVIIDLCSSSKRISLLRGYHSSLPVIAFFFLLEQSFEFKHCWLKAWYVSLCDFYSLDSCLSMITAWISTLALICWSCHFALWCPVLPTILYHRGHQYRPLNCLQSHQYTKPRNSSYSQLSWLSNKRNHLGQFSPLGYTIKVSWVSRESLMWLSCSHSILLKRNKKPTFLML